MTGRALASGMGKIAGFGILTPVIGHLAFDYLVEPQQFLHEPLHALVEGLGSFIAVTILFLIQSGKGLLRGTQLHNLWIISALASMAVFDGFHAGMRPGNLFVWFHTLATFSGGILFSLVWLPDRVTSRLRYAPVASALVSVAACVVFLLLPGEALPAMIQAGKFTPLARILNFLGGVMFVAASAYFLFRYVKDRSRNQALLASHCLLFGSSGILFEFSSAWDPGWWFWHFMRLGAYSILVHFFYQTFRDAEREIDQLNGKLAAANRDLENRVEQRARQIRDQQEIIMASAKMAALGEMAGGIAHEINTPLASIKAIAGQIRDVLDDEAPDRPLLKGMASSVERTTDRIAKIIHGLRTFSRDGSMDPFQSVRVRDLVDETLSLCLERFQRSGTEVRVDEFDADLRFDGRATEISQVLLNLLGNAYDAVSGMERRWIRISAEAAGEWIEIAVEDSGGGIPAEIQGKIFQPFFTTKEIGKGTGMGLSLSSGLVQRHGGALELDRASSHTRFVIRLPRRHRDAGAA